VRLDPDNYGLAEEVGLFGADVLGQQWSRSWPRYLVSARRDPARRARVDPVLMRLAGRLPAEASGLLAVNKWLTASVADDAADVIAAGFDEASRRDPDQHGTWIALVDGNNHQIGRIKAEARRRSISVPIIVDFIHVLEYLWKAAWCFHAEADPAAETWVAGHATAILEGRAGVVAAAIRRSTRRRHASTTPATSARSHPAHRSTRDNHLRRSAPKWIAQRSVSPEPVGLHLMGLIGHTSCMSLEAGSARSLTFRLALAAAEDDAGIGAAIELGNRARATLGHMPFAAYRDAAAKGTLLLAYDGDQVIGYALFGLTRNRVRLTHLCVAAERHGCGVARQLVEWISHRHTDYPGILVKCRVSYHLGDMWIKLGFTQMSERPGRSKAGHVLVSWWRDHHHANLFTRDDDSVLVRATIDVNVLRDLTEEDRVDAVEAQALVADQVADRLDLVRTAALDAEINQMGGPLRARCTTRVQQLASPRWDPDPARLRQIRDDLIDDARRIDAGYPGSDQDRFDLEHVAEAIAVGVHVFITRDEHLTRMLGSAARQGGVRILRPVDVVIHLDELARAEAYRPAALLGTAHQQRLIGVGGEDDLARLVNQAAGERPKAFLKTVRDLALAGCDRLGVYGPDADLVAAVALRHDRGGLTVPLLRVANTGLADTLACQMLFQLRQQARDRGTMIIRITDRYLSSPARFAALNDGFREHGGDFYAFAVDRCAPASEVEHHAAVAARQVGIPEPAPLRSDMPAVAAAELERTWWPAKLVDSQLPTHLIPIQQVFSAELLGVPEGLFPRHDGLGLAREHVYYRSPLGARLEAPARLLWYMSSTSPDRPRPRRGRAPTVPYPSGVIACAQLDAVVTGPAEVLFDQFRHLGVWDQGQVSAAARHGRVQALRFTNTELLTHVPKSRLRAIAAEHGQTGLPPQWPIRISPAMFTALYQEGRQR
jgi:GNAT superfamily N-acetyltransferase